MTKVIKGKREGCGLSSSHFDLALWCCRQLFPFPFSVALAATVFCQALRVGTTTPVELSDIPSIPFPVRAEVRRAVFLPCRRIVQVRRRLDWCR